MTDQQCGLPHYDYPFSRCTESAGHDGPHAAPLVIDGSLPPCGGISWDAPAPVPDQPETFHACPPDGSGLTPCCGRTPFELPRGDRISSETVTCTGPRLERAESVASHGSGQTATVDIDVTVPGQPEPTPLEIPLDAARTLHAMLGDLLADHAPAPADLRERIAEALHSDQTPPPALPWHEEQPLDREYFLRRAAAVLAVLPERPDRAAVERVRAVLETEAVVGRSALEYRGLIASALMADEAQQPEPAPADLRDQYAAAIYEHNNSGYRWADAHPDDLLAYGFDADAVLAVRDRELEQLQAEVAELRQRFDNQAQAATELIEERRQLEDRVRAELDDLCREPHPSHDHICPDDVRRSILRALNPQEQP